MADDLGWSDLGFGVSAEMPGSDYYETPNIRALARRGLCFTHAYAAAANSAPSRACLMSGLYTPRHGVYTVSPSARGEASQRRLIPIENTDDLSRDCQTIGEALTASGYDCAAIGKWHLGQDGEGTGPLDRGFCLNVAGSRAGSPKTYWHNGTYLTDSLHRAALDFIRNHAAANSRPFFLYLAHYAVHVPLQAPDSLVSKFRAKPAGRLHKNAKYAAMIASVDNSVGEIVRTLDELGLSEQTLIVFYSDNGGMEPTTDNAPLRGGKGEPYEGGVRVPLVMSWPQRLPQGDVSDVPVSGVDFFATFAALAGAQPRQQLDGRDIFSLLSDPAAAKERPLFWHFPAYLEAYKGAGEGPWRATPYSSVVQGGWKLIHHYETGADEVFDLQNDPAETRNVLAPAYSSKESRKKAKTLRRTLKNWLKSTHAPIPTEKNPAYVEK